MTEKTKSNLVEIATWSVLAALLGGVLTFLALTHDENDPDRPPIIVRNGSVTIGEGGDPPHGSLEKDPTKRTWAHKHDAKGPKRLNAFVVGIANNSCGNGVTNFVSNVKKIIVSYTLGNDIWKVEILIRSKQIEIDVISGPDPTNLDAWTLSFSDPDAKLTEALFEFPTGTDTCKLDPGAAITITQHK